MSKSDLAIHQLSKGSKTASAIYVCECTGWSNDELARLCYKLCKYQTDNALHSPENKSAIYSFIKHDTKSTKNFEIGVSSDSFIGDELETNTLVMENLKYASNTVRITSDGKILPGVYYGPLNLNNLTWYFA